MDCFLRRITIYEFLVKILMKLLDRHVGVKATNKLDHLTECTVAKRNSPHGITILMWLGGTRILCNHENPAFKKSSSRLSQPWIYFSHIPTLAANPTSKGRSGDASPLKNLEQEAPQGLGGSMTS